MPTFREHTLETTFVRQTSMRLVYSTPQFSNPCRTSTLVSNEDVLNMTKGQLIPLSLVHLARDGHGARPKVQWLARRAKSEMTAVLNRQDRVKQLQQQRQYSGRPRCNQSPVIAGIGCPVFSIGAVSLVPLLVGSLAILGPAAVWDLLKMTRRAMGKLYANSALKP
jgi:hypothetical protein